jgi:hypothetical protein
MIGTGMAARAPALIRPATATNAAIGMQILVGHGVIR